MKLFTDFERKVKLSETQTKVTTRCWVSDSVYRIIFRLTFKKVYFNK